MFLLHPGPPQVEKNLTYHWSSVRGAIHLAFRLSVKTETFSRILHSFSEQGLVRVKGGHIEILDSRGLRKHAESACACGQQLCPANDIWHLPRLFQAFPRFFIPIPCSRAN
ncbi:helix-turn-helix domain-containing protein [Candidatus Vondammii sp. HM_W22]|uniref:helix-turn-helix domain-containing protein n=1 Tax=Candidatus Vondammii sp. HM_W22 TaxID=2687299 RepID=UPI001F14805C|nr:helix-turn-helix domain-containing protein [Candidatus Vondammii sp. HM_W22]